MFPSPTDLAHDDINIIDVLLGEIATDRFRKSLSCITIELDALDERGEVCGPNELAKPEEANDEPTPEALAEPGECVDPDELELSPPPPPPPPSAIRYRALRRSA